MSFSITINKQILLNHPRIDDKPFYIVSSGTCLLSKEGWNSAYKVSYDVVFQEKQPKSKNQKQTTPPPLSKICLSNIVDEIEQEVIKFSQNSNPFLFHLKKTNKSVIGGDIYEIEKIFIS